MTDIEKGLYHYRDHFKDKVVFCNCDDPTWSNFWRYFHLNFGFLGLKKLISTHYDPEKPTYKLEYEGGDDYNIEAGVRTDLKQNGNFRSPECIELLKETDIVVTNPPYMLQDGGHGASAVPIHHLFVEQAKKLNPRFLVMITPSRWFAGGRGLDHYRDVMLHDNRIRVIYDYPNASDCFPGIEVKGEVSYFLWDRDHKGKGKVTT